MQPLSTTTTFPPASTALPPHRQRRRLSSLWLGGSLTALTIATIAGCLGEWSTQSDWQQTWQQLRDDQCCWGFASMSVIGHYQVLSKAPTPNTTEWSQLTAAFWFVATLALSLTNASLHVPLLPSPLAWPVSLSVGNGAWFAWLWMKYTKIR